MAVYVSQIMKVILCSLVAFQCFRDGIYFSSETFWGSLGHFGETIGGHGRLSPLSVLGFLLQWRGSENSRLGAEGVGDSE